MSFAVNINKGHVPPPRAHQTYFVASDMGMGMKKSDEQIQKWPIATPYSNFLHWLPTCFGINYEHIYSPTRQKDRRRDRNMQRETKTAINHKRTKRNSALQSQ